MKVVNIHDAKTHLSKYLKQVAEGQEVVIGKYDQPVAKLVPYQPVKPAYKFGLLKGKLQVAADFDAADERLNVLFEGR